MKEAKEGDDKADVQMHSETDLMKTSESEIA